MIILEWPHPLVCGRLIRRRHRFLLDAELDDGRAVTAHCPNPGRLLGLVRPGAKIWLSPSMGLGRTLRWTWELIEIDGILVGANCSTANRIAYRVLEKKLLPGFKNYKELRAEQFIAKHIRIDFELLGARRRHFIEVKNCHVVFPDRTAYFPDSLTLRSIPQLSSLCAAVREGIQASLLVVVQRQDVLRLRPSDLFDPAFAKALREAAKLGVKVRALAVQPTLKGFVYHGEIPVSLRPYPLAQTEEWSKLALKYSGWERPKGNLNAQWRKNLLLTTPMS